ncbi:uncharacterized protein [Montipora foliosa]|uniref:uncharacterized protein n=1 Tax=Montipora foliosa TaxID=591990 RepID=UPI0035F1D5A7
MCLFGIFVEGNQRHGKNPTQFRPIALKNITTAPRRLPEFLQGDKERHDATKIQVSESPADRSIQADNMRQSGLRKYQFTWEKLNKTQSSRDMGTLFYFRQRFGRTNVPPQVKKNYAGVQALMLQVLQFCY